LVVSKSLNQKYADASIIDVVEYIEKDGTSYLVTIHSDKKELVIHAFTDGSSYVFKKTKMNSK
jgi:hypothetical protein